MNKYWEKVAPIYDRLVIKHVLCESTEAEDEKLKRLENFRDRALGTCFTRKVHEAEYAQRKELKRLKRILWTTTAKKPNNDH